jgi:hypothetical protein
MLADKKQLISNSPESDDKPKPRSFADFKNGLTAAHNVLWKEIHFPLYGCNGYYTKSLIV